MIAYTTVEKPSGISYEGTNLWDAAYLPWLTASYPWLKSSITMSIPTYTEIIKPS